MLRARELGNEIPCERSRLSHQVARTEKRGLVVREECAEDGRGLRLTDAAPKHAETVRRYFFDLLSDDELETLGSVHDPLLDNLQR